MQAKIFTSAVFLFPFFLWGQQCTNPNATDCLNDQNCASKILNQTLTTTCTDKDYSARDYVRLSPPFKFEPQAGQKFHAWVDNNIVLPVDYSTEAPPAFGRTLDTDLPVGSIPGSADVTSTGGATYQIPIHIPPGTNGMQPKVSLVYNSQSGNGIAGWGWNIGGLSVITREQQDLFHDNQIIGVNLSGTDRFSLDGNLLIAVSDASGNIGSYGANGTVYHTELETFNQITSNGTAGNGPEWFEVLTKQGLIIEYGNTSDSRFMDAGGTNVLFWRINKIRDLNGNYVEYIYNNDDSESRIIEIKYTGTSDFDPYNSIKFYYSEREDKNEIWIAGYSVKSDLILRSIGVFVEGNRVKEYELKHFNKQSPLSSERPHSFFGEIIEYNGSSHAHYNSTAFRYGDDNVYPLNSTAKVSSPSIGSKEDLMSGDYDGNGRSDLLVGSYDFDLFGKKINTGYKVFLKPDIIDVFASQSFADLLPAYNSSADDLYSIIDSRADFNGNGRDEFAIARFNSSWNTAPNVLVNIKLYEKDANSNNFSDIETIIIPGTFNYAIKPSALKHFYFPGDFNGDGASDFIILLSNGSGNYKAYMYFPFISATANEITGAGINATTLATNWDHIYVLDFNGDGKHDLMVVNGNTTNIYSFTQSGAATSIYSGSFPTGSDYVFVADFNGDRKNDLLTVSTGNIAKVSYSTGTVFQQTPFSFNNTLDLTQQKLKTGDYNGDGKSDILHAFNSGSGSSKIEIYYSNGRAFKFVENSFSQSISEDPFLSGDFNGDGRVDEIHFNDIGQPFEILYFNPNEHDLLLKEVANGINHITKFDYKSLSDGMSTFGNSYRRIKTSLPFNYIYKGPIYVVKEIQMPASTGANKIVYSFDDAVIHREGRGFLGFENMLTYNFLTNIKTQQKKQLDNIVFYLIPDFEEISSMNTTTSLTTYKPLSHTTFSSFCHYYGDKRFFPYTSQTITDKFFPPNSGSSPKETITEKFAYDNNFVNGNIEKHTIIYTNLDGSTAGTITKNNFTSFNTTDYGTWWNPSRLSNSRVIMSRPFDDNSEIYVSNPTHYVREVSFPSYNAAGQLLKKETDPDMPKKVTTNFDYSNPFGNLKSTTVEADGDQITNSISFDPKGRFVTTTTNALSQSSTAEYEPVYGNITRQTSVDGQVTAYKYDAFGRSSEITTPDGNTIINSIEFDFSTFPGLSVYSVYNQIPGAPDVKTIYNILGMELRTETEGLNGKIITDKVYDYYLNRVSIAYLPYYNGASSKPYTEFKYDADYGYLKKEILHSALCSNCSTTYSIDQKTLTTTNAAGQISTKTTNALGEIITATDNGGSVSYIYDRCGLPKSITSNGSVVSMKYDDYGRQTELTDPNAGTMVYEYNSLGQLIKQTDARSNLYEMKYDLLGRIEEKKNVIEGSTTWQYVNAGNGLNRVKRITGTFSRTDFDYDNLGRTTRVSDRISGVAYDTKYSYDSYSRIKQITYPTADANTPGYKIDNTYNDNGYLTLVKNATTNASIWELTYMNALGQPTHYNLGSNIISEKSYDELGNPLLYKAVSSGQPDEIQNMNFGWNYHTGNMNYRADDRTGFMITENFTDESYDNLNRLLKTEVSGQDPVELNYFNNGNIQNKTRIGSYSYDGDKLNAVEQIGNPAGDISLEPQHIDYTLFNKVSKITEENYEMTIAYGPDQQRRQSILTNLTTSLEERNIIYSGSYEKIKASDGNTYEVTYLPGGAINVRTNGTTNQLFYVFTDHLGSLNSITDADGNIVYEQNFDAWGRERNPADWNYDDPQTKPPWLIRGFTGHEHLDEFKLINMNGRVYDPLLGRMLSPDNFVQAPDFTQSYNRYSYAFNNPLIYNDPTGQSPNPTVDAWGSFWAYIIGLFNSGGSNTSSGIAYTINLPVLEVVDYSNAITPFYKDAILGDMARMPNINGNWGSFSGGIPASPNYSNAYSMGYMVPISPNIPSGESPGPIETAIPIAITAAAADGPVIPIGDIIGAVVLAGAVTYDLKERTYLTYTLTNPTTHQFYAGRASGLGDPYSIMMNRFSGHHMRAFGYANPKLDVAAQGIFAYPAIRGREQQLIDRYGGVGNSMVGNRIRGVGYYTDIGQILHNYSNLYFGPLAPYTGFWK